MFKQLTLFDETDDITVLRIELRAMRETSEKVRKSLYARHNELAKMYLELNQRLDIIERNICHGR